MGLTWEPRSWPDGLRPTKRLWRRENFPGLLAHWAAWLDTTERVSARSSGRRPHPRPSFAQNGHVGPGADSFQ